MHENREVCGMIGKLVRSVIDSFNPRAYNENNNVGKNLPRSKKQGEGMKRFNPKTKTYRVFNALYNGEALTSAKAKKLGIGNLGAEVRRIRLGGYAVYANRRTATNGANVTEYVMGKPSREIVALGYAAKSKGLTVDEILN